MLFASIDTGGLVTLGGLLLWLVFRTVDHHLKRKETP